MTSLEIYFSLFCPYCYPAKKLLQQKGAPFKEIDVTWIPDSKGNDRACRRAEFASTDFIKGAHVGGCGELYALEANGAMDEILKEVL